MSAIIKSKETSAFGDIRSLNRQGSNRAASGDVPPTAEPRQRPSPEQQRITELEVELAGLKQALDAQRAQAEKDIAAAKANIASEVLDQFKQENDEHIALLGSRLDAVTANFSDRLMDIEVLAFEAARVALDQLFADSSRDHKRVEQMIKRQLERLSKEVVILVSVSCADYSDDAAIKGLATAYPALDIRRDTALQSGEARLNLRLGQVELSERGQCSAVLKAFRDLVEQKGQIS